VALIIFWTGIMLGFLFENSRANKLEGFYFNAETDIFDVQLRGDILAKGDFDCDLVLSENIDFADRIYEEARELEKYDAASKITDDIIDLHKRYDLLRVMLWNNLLDIGEKCPGKTNILVYLYEYDDPDVNLAAKQITFSKVTLDTKKKYGDKVILIPIAYDTGISSLSLFREKYDLHEFPVVLVNQKDKFTELFTLEDIEAVLVLDSDYFFSSQ